MNKVTVLLWTKRLDFRELWTELFRHFRELFVPHLFVLQQRHFFFQWRLKKLFGLKSIRKKIAFSANHWKSNRVDLTKLRDRHRRNRCVTVTSHCVGMTSHCVTWISGRYNKVQHLKKPSPIQTFSWKWYLKLHRLYFYNTGQRFHGANLSLLGKKLKTGFGWDGFDWFLNGGHATFARTTSVLNN